MNFLNRRPIQLTLPGLASTSELILRLPGRSGRPLVRSLKLWGSGGVAAFDVPIPCTSTDDDQGELDLG